MAVETRTITLTVEQLAQLIEYAEFAVEDSRDGLQLCDDGEEDEYKEEMQQAENLVKLLEKAMRS